MRPTISVIIPCHNGGKTICRALASLEQQSFNDFETIVINDGSTDDTGQKIADYTVHSPLKLTLISQRNAGAAAARNAGIQAAKGEWLAFLDADDVFHKDLLRALFLGICHDCDTAFGYTSRDTQAILQEKTQIPQSDYSFLPIDKAMEEFMYHKEKIHFTNFIYSAQILRDCQIAFRSGVQYGEDLEFVWKYLARCQRACVIRRPIYGYENNPHSAVHKIRWSKTDLADAMLRTGDYIKKYRPSFAPMFTSYMIPRAMWTVAKTFAVGNEYEMYQLFCRQYHLRRHMAALKISARSRLLRISSQIYLTSPLLFYHAVRWSYQWR